MREHKNANPEIVSSEEKMSNFLHFLRWEGSILPAHYPMVLACGESEPTGNMASETIIVPNYKSSVIDISAYEENTHIEKIEYPAVTREGFFTLSTAIKKNDFNPEKNELYPNELYNLQDIIKIQKKTGIVLPSYIFDRPQGYFKGSTGSYIRIGNIRIGEATPWTPLNKIILEKDYQGEKFLSVMQTMLGGLMMFSSDKERISIMDFMTQLQTEFEKVADITQ